MRLGALGGAVFRLPGPQHPGLPASFTMSEDARQRVPILLLKTKSTPADAYEEYFSTFDARQWEPAFVPVLEHRFKQEALDQVRQHIAHGDFLAIDPGSQPAYGAIIFTSQRAVEAFSHVINDFRKEGLNFPETHLPASVPLYAVGPATARGLRALNLSCPVLGEETGNGEALSSFILEHYNSRYQGARKPRILFLVGEKRRDIIPNTLQSAELPREKRSEVRELVVYETGEMRSFKANFSDTWKRHTAEGKTQQWVVVFSPTGCQAMLESLDLVEADTGRAKPDITPRGVKIATIGPTTRDYLVKEFNFTPDVCAAKPSPEGIAEGIREYNVRNA